MHRFLPLLIIPLVFTFVFDYYAIIDKNADILASNPPKNFILKENVINIHKNFNFKSSTINNLYSEKVIQSLDEENIVILQPKIKAKFLEKSETINTANITQLNNSLHLISSGWQNSFSNKKIKFIETVLPLIAFENHKILLERKKLLKIKDYLSFEKTLKKNNLKYLENILNKYKISSKNKHKIDLINELLFNVNVIPNSIVLAQAANESGWGTSRFAREYNALFGQYTYDENKGIVPFEREEGKKHLIKNFTSINKSVESYFQNINSHYAYKNFRKLRSQIRDLNNDFNIKILTNALDVYAEDESYVETINKIIDSNNLNQFDLSLNVFLKS
tara:strand:+ start:452 stop:1453 length:1002 start_codon:yes stop_codon:yes gene_type:complete